MMKKRIISVLLTVLLVATVASSLFVTAAAEAIVLAVNGLDVTGMEGHALVLTRRTGMTLPDVGNSFTWWRTVLFEYSDEAEAYVVTALSLTASGSAPKQVYIPEDGFVLAVNTGNDYGYINYQNPVSSATYDAVAKLNIGDKAYVTGMDFSTGYIDKSSKNHWDSDFTTNAKIYIGTPPSDATIYSPDRSASRLEQVALSVNDGDMISGSADWSFSWDAVDGADYYLVNINDGVSGDIGAALVSNLRTAETSITVPKSKLVIGYVYRIAVTAVSSSGLRSSLNTNVKVTAVSDRAVNSPFNDKTVVAFGDSITAFTGWVKMLGGELGTTVVNAGVGGNNTNDALNRITTDVLKLNPDIVIMMFGMNDQAIIIDRDAPIISVENYERNYRKMIEMMQQQGIDVVLMTGHEVCTDTNYYVPGGYNLNYGTGNIDNYYNVVRSLAAEYNLNLIDLTERCEAETRAKICAMGDGIHLSTYGHEMYTRWISDFFFDDYVAGLGLDEPEPDISDSEASDDTTSDETSHESQSSEEPVTSADASTEASSDITDNYESHVAVYIIIAACVVLISGAAVFFIAFRKK